MILKKGDMFRDHDGDICLVLTTPNGNWSPVKTLTRVFSDDPHVIYDACCNIGECDYIGKASTLIMIMNGVLND